MSGACWAPVPLRWRHVQPGDVVVGNDGRLWIITQTISGAGFHVRAVHNGAPDGDVTVTVDPDGAATVLVPTTERDALVMTRAELGARVESRRLNPDGATLPERQRDAPQVPATANVAGT